MTTGTEDQVLLAVSDTGPGIPKEKQEEIFHPFTQADVSTTRKHGGSGLGLAVCNRLADMMGGHIALESTPGQGATFTFTVPLPAADSDEINRVMNVRDSIPSTGGATTAASNANILLVEDVEENQMVIQGFLSQSGCQIEIAENGDEAVKKFKNGHYDLVLMDIQMPVMDGYEATLAIRAWEAATGVQPTHIVALTAHAMKEEAQKIMDVGCDLHLSKPIRKARLLEVLQNYKLK